MNRQMHDFIIELEKFIDVMKEIDKDVPWQPVEPLWWQEMKKVEMRCLVAKKSIRDRYHV